MLKDLKTTSFQSLRPNIGRCDCGLALRIMLILVSFVVAIAVLLVQQRVSSLRSQKDRIICALCVIQTLKAPWFKEHPVSFAWLRNFSKSRMSKIEGRMSGHREGRSL